jgi:hypothetical protein
MVSLASRLRFRPRGHAIEVRGTARLVDTTKSPSSGDFTVTGHATLAPDAGRRCTANRWRGTLTLGLTLSR